jgi:hypothetical protein
MKKKKMAAKQASAKWHGISGKKQSRRNISGSVMA